MATANDNICDVCDRAVTSNEECPLVVYVSAYRVGGPGFLDPTGLSAGMVSLVSAQGVLPRLELDGSCASKHVRLSPELVRRLNEMMLDRRQITPELAAKRQTQADAEHEAYVRAEVKRLDAAAKKTAKAGG